MTNYSKAIWAFLSALLGAITTAVMAAPTHTFSGVDTLGWLGVATTVLITTGGVYGLTNQPTPPTPPPGGYPSPARPVEDPTPMPVELAPGYQPDPQHADQTAKAQRLARAKQTITDAAMSGPTDADVFRTDMHQAARRAANLGDNPRPPWVPHAGNPPIG